MRSHRAILAVAAIGAATAVAPAVAGAASSGDSLTINATPNPVLAGAGVDIYGQLSGPSFANEPILLYHRVAGAAKFTLVSKGMTNAQGFYEFTRADGIVETNRNWFVKGPDGARSPVVHEKVYALVSLNASSTTGTTRHPLVFTGSVSPAHPHQRVLLQKEIGVNGTNWKTIAVTDTGPKSNFRFVHGFAFAGDDTLRAYLPGDPRNIASASDAVTVQIQQPENKSFTITSSTPVSVEDQQITISGTLYARGSTTTPKAGVQVTLYGKEPGARFQPLYTTKTLSNGSYSFTQAPIHNTVYYVALTRKPSRHTVTLFQGVRDSLKGVTYSATSTPVGDPITVTGVVLPNKAGHEITLQRLGADGAWQDIRFSTVTKASTFSFTVRFGQTGTVDLRVRILGGPANVGTASPEQAITVTPATGTTPPPSS